MKLQGPLLAIIHITILWSAPQQEIPYQYLNARKRQVLKETFFLISGQEQQTGQVDTHVADTVLTSKLV
jgi:hypothetical protein